ncbi:MAG: penicillin acylase family protein [Polyangiaceae bacterium]
MRKIALASFLGIGLCACTEEPTNPAPSEYRVEVRRTSYGVPHVKADDYASLGYGVGYAAGQDYGCYLADQIVKIRAERAATLGPGDKDANVDSDFAYAALHLMDTAAAELPKQPEDVRDLVTGYAAGYSRWVTDTGVDNLPQPCKGAAWVKPITPVELFAYTLDLALRGSAVAFLSYLGKAAPPGANPPPPAPADSVAFDLAHPGFGSNGWALGRDRTESGSGIVLGNPHFPWEGEIHWHEAHLTIPGKLDVYGVSILGSPTIQIGFNQHLAWTHTVSPSQHLTVYKLALSKSDPTRYLVDGAEHAMKSEEATISVKQPDGTTQKQTRTLYRTDDGPVVAGPGLTWTATTAYALRDANEGDVRLAEQWLRIDQAENVADLVKAHADVHAVPWVYTIAADDHGDTVLLDGSRVPNLSAEATAAYEEALQKDQLTGLLAKFGATLLDGSTSRDAWIASDEAYADGLVPIATAPSLARADFVMNANDAPWATNPAKIIDGYSFLYGPIEKPLIPRSRMNLEMLTEEHADGASGADGKFSRDEVIAALFADREIVAEQLKDDVAARCAGAVPAIIDGVTVDVQEACSILAAWSGRADLDAPGAVLWREYLGQFPFVEVMTSGTLYDTPFDPTDPVHTPSALTAKAAGADDPIVTALAKAILVLQKAGLPLDATLGDTQYTMKGDKRIPVPGGAELEGAANVVSYYGKGSINTSTLPEPVQAEVLDKNTGLTADGYLCNKGTSFLIVAEMTPNGPSARALLTTSESRDPASPHYADQTEMFSKKEMRDVLFTDAQIAADPELTTLTLTAER